MTWQSHDLNRVLRRIPTIAAVAALIALVPLGGASAYTYKVLHNFNGANGDGPSASILEDGAGNLYGTTTGGGKYHNGVVFKMVPNGQKYTYQIIKNFCAKPDCTDGSIPMAHLVMDADGDLWGTTYLGGKYNGGVLFELIPVANGWAWKIVHNFGNGSDGNLPAAGLTYTGQQANELWGEGFEPAFGTTLSGGKYGNGVVYKLARSGSTWSYTIIRSLSSGAGPQELAMDSAGNLFGTTSSGGAYGGGLMFKLASGTWKETTLHQFCAQAGCPDGNSPIGRLWIDSSGNLFGATFSGGTGGGTVFEYIPGGGFHVLYNFCSVVENDVCTDGKNPPAGVIMDSSGALFGTTQLGNPVNTGTAFTLVKQGAQWQHAVIGLLTYPAAPLALDFYNGDFYGTGTDEGIGAGVVFALKP